MSEPEQPTTSTPSDEGAWWGKWVRHHVELFGKQAQPDWLQTLLKWKLLFVGKYSKDEMFAASNFLATCPPGKGFMDEHLSAIMERLKGMKAQRATRIEAMQRQERLDANRCKLCGNTGWVTVPHIRCIDYGKWVPLKLTSSGAEVYYTMAVACVCYFGDRIRASNMKVTLLADIDGLCPDWLRLMKRQHEDAVARAAQAREGRPKTKLDDTLERLLKLMEEGKFVSTMPEREGEDY